MFGVYKHSTCQVLQIPDSLFSNSVLKVCIYSRGREGLMVELAVVLKSWLDEPSVVCMVVLDCYSVSVGKGFECSLSL